MPRRAELRSAGRSIADQQDHAASDRAQNSLENPPGTQSGGSHPLNRWIEAKALARDPKWLGL